MGRIRVRLTTEGIDARMQDTLRDNNTTTTARSKAGRPVIEAHRLSQRVPTGSGTLTILEDITLTINAGDSVAIVGPSGSGKSTLLGLLAGLDRATEGSIALMGQTLEHLDEDARAALRGRHVGFVFQNFQLLPSLTALENVSLPLEVLGRSKIGEDLARPLLERVGLGARLDHYPHQLSGGEQQRVALARAFVTGPDILFADEPTGNLDTRTGRTVIDLLFDLNREQGTTLVLITHDDHLARRCAVQFHLEGGRLIDDPPADRSSANTLDGRP